MKYLLFSYRIIFLSETCVAPPKRDKVIIKFLCRVKLNSLIDFKIFDPDFIHVTSEMVTDDGAVTLAARPTLTLSKPSQIKGI